MQVQGCPEILAEAKDSNYVKCRSLHAKKSSQCNSSCAVASPAFNNTTARIVPLQLEVPPQAPGYMPV